MLSYYAALKKDDENLSFKKNINLSYAIQKVAEDSFSPFKTYLKNAIENAKKKNDIQAKWRKMGVPARIELVGNLYKVPNTKNLYRIILPEEETMYSIEGREIVAKLKEGGRERFSISDEIRKKGIIRIENDISTFDSISWDGEAIELEALGEKESIPKGGICIERVEEYSVFYCEKEPKDTENYEKIDKITPYIDFEALRYESGGSFKATHLDKRNFLLDDEKDIGKTLLCNDFKFTVEEASGRDKYWIQLIEIEDDKEKSALDKSPLSYFFDDDMSVTDLKGNKYKIVAGDEEESRILLKKADERGNNYCFPETPIIQTEVNTYQLDKEAEAICTLMNMPVGEQRGLIRLFEDRDKVRWEEPASVTVKKWEVLTSEEYDGCLEQRKFVLQALNTPDFAILEGPPGSGKTTVILELICQLAQKGKRILLCGSTHIAIDNILERLKEKDKESKSLLERWNILPLRIGDEKRINEDIREFQIDNQIREHQIPENILLDIANLVCGTTIGILQHPHFKGRKGRLDLKEKQLDYHTTAPILPEFDYLIIDESSKTTFQEFLVPALYGKKWILVGDIKQLSPFCDREEIVSNIEQLDQMPSSLQSAVFLLQKLKSCFHKYNKFILPASYEEILDIVEELEAGREKDFEENKKVFCVITTHSELRSTSRNILVRSPKKVSRLELSVCDVILVEKDQWDSLWEQYPYLIPETHTVLFKEDWQNTEQAFLHNSYQQTHPFAYKEKDKTYTDSFEIAKLLTDYFVDRSWAEEIAWRIEREHQLRMVENKNNRQSYQKVLNELMPCSLEAYKIEGHIHRIASMAFPSILESLIKGVGVSYSNSSIVKGLNDGLLKQKHTVLSYQHRMHEDISAFPRDQFYNNKALKDSSKVLKNRQWDYKRYEQRNVWLHVTGEVYRNKNKKEVDKLIEELKHFLLYAQNHPHPEGKNWEVACLTFYRGQETLLREQLQKLTDQPQAFSSFSVHKGKYPIHIKLHTVDKFQGHEADIVFLSMVQNKRVGFLDNPNRLNVAITRAKYQLVILGNTDYFRKQTQSEDLKKLAQYYESDI